MQLLRLSFCFFSFGRLLVQRKKKRSHAIFEIAWLIVLGVFGCFNYPLFGVGIKSPVDLFIGQRAVYSSAHHHSTIFKDFALGFLSVCGCYLKRTFKDVLSAYSVNFPSIFQTSAISNLCSIGSPFDSQRWVSQK